MRGHLPLIAMRRRGLRPSLVWIDTDPDVLRCWRDWPTVDATVAHVQLGLDDSPALLDLRWLIGLNVIVSGADAQRVEAVGQACRDHEAARVITAACADPARRAEPMHVTDTLEPTHG